MRHVQLRKLFSQLRHIRDSSRALLRIEDFRHSVSNLRSEQAEPHLFDLRARRPKFQEFLQVSRSLHHLTCDRAMNRDPLPLDVLENAIVGCWRSPDIVFRLQAINEYDDVESRQNCPSWTHRPERTGNNLDVDSARQ